MAKLTSVSKRIAAAARENELQIRKTSIEIYCKSIHEAAKSNNGILPYGYMTKFVEENRKNSSWLTSAMMQSAYNRFKKKILDVPQTYKPGEIQVTSSFLTVNSSLSDLSSQTSSIRVKRSKVHLCTVNGTTSQ